MPRSGIHGAERGVVEVVRVDVEEEELAVLQFIDDARHCAPAQQPAQLPHHVRLFGDLEEDLRRAQLPAHATGQRLEAVDLLRLRDDDGVVLDEDGAVADGGFQVTDLARTLPLLGAARRLGGLTDAAIEQPLRADLRVAEDRRRAHVDAAQ
jgi:hypothetical protein